MRALKQINKFSRDIDNKTVIDEEVQGYGEELHQGHQTTISDPMLMHTIKKMSFLEVVG